MAVGNVVQIFNRTPFVLTATKDGRQYKIKPGYSYLTADVVMYARAQNPVMGTEDPNSLSYESLISRVVDPESGDAQRDSLEPIPEAILALMPKERINRSLYPPDRQGKSVEELQTQFPQRRVGVEQPSDGMIDPGKFGADTV